MSKKALSITLIAFVCFSIGYLIYSEINPNKVQNAQQTVSTSLSLPNYTTDSTSLPNEHHKGKVIVYYFHGTYI